MIDANDKQTKPLALDEQPARAKRGRPATGKAMSNAERQKKYREKNKRNVTELAKQINRNVTNNVQELNKKIRELETLVGILSGDLRIQEKRTEAAERELAERNAKPEKTWTLQGRTGTGKWQNLAAGLDEKEASRQLDRVIDAKISGMSTRQYRLVQD